MSLRLRLYLVAVGLAALALLAISHPPDLDHRWIHYVAWTLVCYVSESLWLTTLSGSATSSMASTANVATLMLWGPAASVWIVSMSTILANIFLQRKPWVRALFNASQSAVTMWLAGWVAVALGTPAEGVYGQHAMIAETEVFKAIPSFLAMVIAYIGVNRALVSVAVAWSSDRPYWRVLREGWFFRERFYSDLALFLLSPIVVICFEAIRYVGLILFYAPLRIIYESSLRYAELVNAQKLLIHSERMAAKGEMAAEIGHELRNQLVAIHGRAQMLIRDAVRQQFANVGRHSQIILEQAHRVEAMSKGLMDFSRAELKIEQVDLNALVQRSVEFVRPQNRFDPIEWDLRLAAALPGLRADPGQLQQVLLNLFMNAADAMEEANVAHRTILLRTESDERRRLVRLVVQDSGPGIEAALLAKVFEPHFTTKDEGHGFGLSTSYRIVTNHGGQIVAESEPGQGARFTVTLPLDGPGGWSSI
jgi:signal transduction histidine kinase